MHWLATQHMDVALRGLGWGRSAKREAQERSPHPVLLMCMDARMARAQDAQERPPLRRGRDASGNRFPYLSCDYTQSSQFRVALQHILDCHADLRHAAEHGAESS